MNLRRQVRLLQQQAARMGVPGTERFFAMTPFEISLQLEAFAASQRQKLEEMHASAHLQALAFHAPRRLPVSPPVPSARTMTPEEMKKRLLGWRRKE